MIRSLTFSGNERVLDHGSGTGLMIRLLHQRHPRIQFVALDPSADLLRGLTAPSAHLETICSTTTELLGSTNGYGRPFDAVLSNYVLQFCGEPTAELSRLVTMCRRGAQLRVSVLGAAPDVEPFYYFWSAARARIVGADEPGAYVHHCLGDRAQLEAAAKDAGWTDVKTVSEVSTRRIAASGAWEWLSRVLPISVDGAYRSITAAERAAVRETFFATWPGSAVSRYNRLEATCP
jgi:ubiquinone/menaquinone biosynthesis C-methylase UbiE